MSLTFHLYDGEKSGADELFSNNITHNLVPMWQKAGVYDALYNSDGKRAREISNALIYGHAEMITSRKEFEKLNSPNGWGKYENAIRFLHDAMEACLKYPEAIIRISK
jgi:hypothetical protein